MSARDLPPELFATMWRGLTPELRGAIRASASRGLEALKTPEPLTLFQWAEKNFYLSAESSQSEGKWRAYPYQRGMLCAMGDDYIQEVDNMKSARTGWTKMLLAYMAYTAQHKRRNQCLWQPTDKDSDEFCKSEVEPMLRDVKAMAKVFPAFMRKSKANTLNMKQFLGALLYLKGGTSAGNYRRMTLQAALGDEFSAFDEKIDGSSDPFTLMWKRLEGATYPQIRLGSTPRVKGFDHIERRAKAATARMRFNIECPHCGVEHPLSWGGPKVRFGIKWDSQDPEGTVHHVCPHCHGKVNQARYLRIWDAGVWVSECGNFRLHALANGEYFWTDGAGCKMTVPPRHVAFMIWTAYSKQVTWAEIVREYLNALKAQEGGDDAPMVGFTNETLGETFEEVNDQVDSHELKQRAEPYPLRRVPVGGLDLVAGVDTQDKWWAVSIVAIGRGDEKWLVDYQELSGDPGDKREWESVLYPYLKTVFHHWHGAPMVLSAAGIDSGGNHTSQVYDFCERHASERFFALKGSSLPGRPIRKGSTSTKTDSKGRPLKRSGKVWWVGTDTAKDLIYSQLMLDKPGPGYIHFSRDLDTTYFKGLTSEERRKKRTVNGVVSYWHQVVDRNEPLDTLVYAMWASHARNHPSYTEKMWERLENDLLPDLFEPLGNMVAAAHGPASHAPAIEVPAMEVDAPAAADAIAPKPGQAKAPAPAPTPAPEPLNLPAPPRAAVAKNKADRRSLFDMAYD